MLQRLASDFLSNYIFLAVGRVGSSTDLIAQKVDYVEDVNKRNHLMHILHDQKVNGTCGKVWSDVFQPWNFLLWHFSCCCMYFESVLLFSPFSLILNGFFKSMMGFHCLQCSMLWPWFLSRQRREQMPWNTGCLWMAFQQLRYMEIKLKWYVFSILS